MQAILTPEQFAGVKNIEKIANALGRSEKVISGSQTAFSARLIAELTLIFPNPALAAKVFASDAILSKAISSVRGQQLLGSGRVIKGTAGEAIKAVSTPIRVSGQASRLKEALDEN